MLENNQSANDVCVDVTQPLQEADRAIRAFDSASAIEICVTLLGKEATNLFVLETLSRALWQAGRFHEVVEIGLQMRTLNPRDPGYGYLIGMAQEAIGNYADAARSLMQAISVCSNPALAAKIETAIAELDEVQGFAVQQLLDSNAMFRAQFAADAVAACREHGIVFSWHIEAEYGCKVAPRLVS